jgi:hypothetical protein
VWFAPVQQPGEPLVTSVYDPVGVSFRQQNQGCCRSGRPLVGRWISLQQGPLCLVAWSWRTGEAQSGGASDQSADEGIEGIVAAPATIQYLLIQDQGGKLGAEPIERLATDDGCLSLVKWSGPTCRHESWLQRAGRVAGLG